MMGRLALLFAMLGALVGCDEPLGIVRVHFLMNPPYVVPLDEDAGPPPVDLFDVSRASGRIEVLADDHHLTSSYSGLPAPADPLLGYLLWLSASESGGDWAFAGPLALRPSGVADAHLDQADVPFDFPTLRSAIVTLDPAGAESPSRLVVLAGVAGNEPEEAAPAGGGTVHEH